MSDKLYRSESDRIIGGVCGGLAEHFDLDPSLVRIITVVLVFSGLSPLFYLIAWLIIPRESEVNGTTVNTNEESSEMEEDPLKE